MHGIEQLRSLRDSKSSSQTLQSEPEKFTYSFVLPGHEAKKWRLVLGNEQRNRRHMWRACSSKQRLLADGRLGLPPETFNSKST